MGFLNISTRFYILQKLAKPSFGWLLTHIPHELGKEKTLAI
jgi:hypothetical protein